MTDLPLQAFGQQDILDFNITYSLPMDGAHVRRIFNVVDSDGETSNVFAVAIIVNPKNTCTLHGTIG